MASAFLSGDQAPEGGGEASCRREQAAHILASIQAAMNRVWGECDEDVAREVADRIVPLQTLIEAEVASEENEDQTTGAEPQVLKEKVKREDYFPQDPPLGTGNGEWAERLERPTRPQDVVHMERQERTWQARRARSVTSAWRRDAWGDAPSLRESTPPREWERVYQESSQSEAYARARFVCGKQVLDAYLERRDHIRMAEMSLWDFAEYIVRLVELQLASNETMRVGAQKLLASQRKREAAAAARRALVGARRAAREAQQARAKVEGEEELGGEAETNTDKASELQRVSLQLATEAEEASSKAVLAGDAAKQVDMKAEVVNLESGRNSNKQGAAFETACLNAVADQYGLLDAEGELVQHENVRLLTNVRLARSNEVDIMVLRILNEPSCPAASQPSHHDTTTNCARRVEVLAIVECKRTPDDIGEAFSRYQRLLAWFRGETDRYNPKYFTSASHPRGHFDSTYHYKDGNETFAFDQSSFLRFARDQKTGHYLDGLVFATRPKTMTGLSSKARNTLLPRVAAAALGVLPPARADSLLTLASLEVVPSLGERALIEVAKLQRLFFTKRRRVDNLTDSSSHFKQKSHSESEFPTETDSPGSGEVFESTPGKSAVRVAGRRGGRVERDARRPRNMRSSRNMEDKFDAEEVLRMYQLRDLAEQVLFVDG